MYTCEGKFNICKFKRHPSGAHLQVCGICDYVVQPRYCPALKVWEMNKLMQTTKVYHQNKHICIPSVNKPEKEQFLCNNMKMATINKAPKHVQMEMLSECVATGDFDKAYDVVKLIDDRELIEKMRYTGDLKDHMNRSSISTLEAFNTITEMKEKADQKDKYLIYEVACKGLSGATNSYVFKSSTGACKLALKMDMANQIDPSKPSQLTKGYVYMDAMHSRTKGYKTLGLYLEHEALKGISTLALMEAEREDTETLTIFLQTFKKMLAEYKKDSSYSFNPEGGFIVDEAGANFNAIRNVFGEDMLKKTFTDHFHFFRCGAKHKVSVAEDERLTFEKLYKRIKHCYIYQEYKKISDQLDDICRRNGITWWEWWKPRRSHIVPIWRGFDTPGLNLAEVGHTTVKQGPKPISLSQAVWRDVLSMIAQDRRLEALLNNEAAYLGKGMSVYQKKKREVRVERMFRRQACDFLATINEATTEEIQAEIDAMDNNESTFLPTKNAKHKAPVNPRRGNVTQEARKVEGKRKRGQIKQDKTAWKKALYAKSNAEAEIDEATSESEGESDEDVPCRLDTFEMQNSPSLVILASGGRGRVKVCYGCKLHYTEAERRNGQDVVFCVWLHREWVKMGEKFRSPVKQPTYFHAYDMACLHQIPQLKAAQKKDIYLPNHTLHSLKPKHIKELKKRKLWASLMDSRDRAKNKARLH